MAFKTLLALTLLISPLYALPGFHEPWGKDTDLLHRPIPEQPTLTSKFSPMVWVTEQVIRFHQEIISPVDGPRSHFRPSSSQYMLQAVQKHGFFQGFVMGCDRLLRENSDEWVYRTTLYNGALYKWDPVP